MSGEVKKAIQLEIGHVLFIDIVSYSKLLITEQSEQLQTLKDIVRATEQFRIAEAAGKLLRLPTGDGGALVFRTSPEAPVLCAMEIAKALKDYPDLRVRMGIHSGPVNEISDLNEQANIAGAGINIAQRVMDCGDAGHILLSKHVADDLEQYPQWRSELHDLGECEVKHGARVHAVNFYTEELGNPELPEKFKHIADTPKTAAPYSGSAAKSAGRRWAMVGAVLLIIGAIAISLFFLRSKLSQAVATTSTGILEKSIAVLPFENLSRDPDNAYFATGIQDEILTRLAKIGALKVISRTSTQQYAARPANLSEIARQLGVAHILEGSVQKAGDQVHINAQLIRATTDEHLWAESYDRKLENIFGVEAEVATSVAEALKARLTGAEHQAVEEKPTSNPKAYDAYLRGLAYAPRAGYSETDTLDAIKYFSEAVELDPKFALAWTWLAHESALGYFNSLGSDVPRLRQTAKHAAEKAAELQPDRGEAYLAKGYYQYYCDRDYDSAITSFDKARQLSPSNSDILQALALIWRRKGEWQLSLKYFQEAIDLDPRNISLLSGQAEVYWELHQYSAALKGYDRVLEISPDDASALAAKAGIYQSKGDLPAAATLISRIRLDSSSELFWVQIQQWMYERRYAEAIDVLENAIAKRDRPLTDWQKLNYVDHLALLQQFSGDTAHARATWQQVKTDAEKSRATKGEEFGLSALVEAYAALGDKTKALATLEQAAALSRGDRLSAAFFAEIRARIAIQAGDRDLALGQLEISAQDPVGIDHGDLKFNPLWDPLRGDPRLQKLISESEPK